MATTGNCVQAMWDNMSTVLFVCFFVDCGKDYYWNYLKTTTVYSGNWLMVSQKSETVIGPLRKVLLFVFPVLLEIYKLPYNSNSFLLSCIAAALIHNNYDNHTDSPNSISSGLFLFHDAAPTVALLTALFTFCYCG